MVLRCAFFHLSRVAEDGNYYRPQRYKNADALYALKSRGFNGEIRGVARRRSNRLAVSSNEIHKLLIEL